VSLALPLYRCDSWECDIIWFQILIIEQKTYCNETQNHDFWTLDILIALSNNTQCQCAHWQARQDFSDCWQFDTNCLYTHRSCDSAYCCADPSHQHDVCRLKQTCTPKGAKYLTTVTDVMILNYAVGLDVTRDPIEWPCKLILIVFLYNYMPGPSSPNSCPTWVSSLARAKTFRVWLQGRQIWMLWCKNILYFYRKQLASRIPLVTVTFGMLKTLRKCTHRETDWSRQYLWVVYKMKMWQTCKQE